MQILRPLLLLLAFVPTRETFASEPTLAHHRKKIAREVLERLATKEADRCLKGCQGSCNTCSRPAIQMAMAKQKEREREFTAKIDPKAHMLMHINKKEASAERAAGRASVGSSVVVLRNRNEVGGTHTAHHARVSAPSQPRRSKL